MTKPVELWIDALDFTEKGGWKEDTQFVHLMGSGCLIAADQPGVPVQDASLQINIPCNGIYRAWVRDRNWLRWHSPGTFNLVVNGNNNERVLGAMPSDGWIWEIAGDYRLEAGTCSISLHDLTGYFGRCASVLLTTDFDYTPPRETDRIRAERARIKGLNDEIQHGGCYEVIIAGGGPGGLPAAIASAREGIRTLLIQDRPILGGNGSSEVGITFDGATIAHIFAREGGIAEEIRRLRDADPKYYGDWTRAMEKLAAAEKNLTVLYNNHIYDVEMESSSIIRSVYALNIRTLSRTKFCAKIYIDCTGDAWLGYYAGAKYRCGREAQYQYNEDIAPVEADTITMSGALKSGNLPFFHDAGVPVEYHAPEWVPKLPESDEEFGRAIDGNGASLLWWLEAPNDYDDIWDGEETRDAMLLVVLGYYDHIKNYWSKRERAKNFRLNFSGIFNGKRESRRLIGDYVLTQNDCTSGRLFDDVVAYSGWGLDVHHPKGIYSGKEGPLHCGVEVPLVSIPYRCLYSKNIDNLLFAGRNVSATHIAIGSLRVQNTITTLGQAAGTAAALCIWHGENPRGIYERHIWELQQVLLKNDQYIPGIKNEDPHDPCLTALVAASSVSTSEIFQTQRGTEGPLFPLDVPRSTLFGISRSDGDVKEIFLKLHSSLSVPCPVTLHTDNRVGASWTFHEYRDVLTVQAIVPPMSETWVRFPVDIKVGECRPTTGGNIQVWLEKAEGISWRSVENLSFHSRRGELRDGKWHYQGSVGLCAASKKPIEQIANCSPENVINGFPRIVDAEHYEWVSNPDEALPQWIELSFRKVTRINTVRLNFDTDLSSPLTCWTVKRPVVPACVKDYDLEVYTEKQWVKIAEGKGNFMRRQIHHFPAVDAGKIRVTVYSTWGDKSARIMEVRASFES